jgi:hypothetical protein
LFAISGASIDPFDSQKRSGQAAGTRLEIKSVKTSGQVIYI